MAIPLDAQAISSLFALTILVVEDSDTRMQKIAPGNAACDGSHCYIRRSEWQKLEQQMKGLAHERSEARPA